MVWDWNGTLFDDVACSVEVANQLLVEWGLTPLRDLAHYRSIFGFPIVDYYRRLGFDVDRDGEFELAANRYHELYGEAVGGCLLHSGAEQVLAAVAERGVEQVVVSAAAQQHLDQQMDLFDIRERFSAVYGLDDVFAASKVHLARRWLDATGATPDEVLFVGDSEHDHEIATAVGARCLLYSGGHHARYHLKGLGAPVLDDLAEVTAFL